MKNLGMIIALIGFLMVAGALSLTPNYTNNLTDSNSGLNASAPIFFSGAIVFGAGVVILANALFAAKRRAAQSSR